MGRPFHAGRLDGVQEALGLMESTTSIEERFSKEWGVGRKTVRRYIAEVRRQWAERQNAPGAIEERRARYTETGMALLRRAILKGHDRAAMTILDTLAKWWGIGTPQMAHAIGVFDPDGMLTSSPAIAARLRELRALQLGASDDDGSNGGGGGTN